MSEKRKDIQHKEIPARSKAIEWTNGLKLIVTDSLWEIKYYDNGARYIDYVMADTFEEAHELAINIHCEDRSFLLHGVRLVLPKEEGYEFGQCYVKPYYE